MESSMLSVPLIGRHCSLKPIFAEAMLDDLFEAAQSDEGIWTHMAYGPFESRDNMYQWLSEQEKSQRDVSFGVLDNTTHRFVGMCGYIAHVPEHKRVEIGHVWYGRPAQKTKINTEATFLLLRHAFDTLGYRRVEWKCDANNGESRRTAERMGFVYEGLFRQHMWVKNRSRDSIYYSMIDREWPKHRADFEQYLAGDSASLTAIKEGSCRLE